MFSALEVLLR